MLTALSGVVAGVFHVLSGPDHLAAVAPLAASDRGGSLRAGWTWGVGHASGVMVVAALAVLLRDALPPVADISAWGERAGGRGAHRAGPVEPVARGAPAPRAARARRAPEHEHVHVQRGPRWMRRLGHGHAAFAVGVLHGVAGSSHFFGVLPRSALPTAAASFSYIAAFGVGTVAAMTAFAGAIGGLGARAHRRAPSPTDGGHRHRGDRRRVRVDRRRGDLSTSGRLKAASRLLFRSCQELSRAAPRDRRRRRADRPCRSAGCW